MICGGKRLEQIPSGTGAVVQCKVVLDDFSHEAIHNSAVLRIAQMVEPWLMPELTKAKANDAKSWGQVEPQKVVWVQLAKE
ncbi:hypothetical protein ACFLV5_02650 [Chloroflexota bacterium]